MKPVPECLADTLFVWPAVTEQRVSLEAVQTTLSIDDIDRLYVAIGYFHPPKVSK